MDADQTDIALVVRAGDFRGDHTENLNIVVRVPRTATVMDLLALAKKWSYYCKAVVEVKEEGEYEQPK